jgi:hypothetical protein
MVRLYGKENHMSAPISEVQATQAAAAAAYSKEPAPHPAPVVPTTAGITLSKVDLSEDAQVHSLQEQGHTPAEIAISLGITPAAVDGYLGIAVPAVASTPVQAPVEVRPTTETAATAAPAAATVAAVKV